MKTVQGQQLVEALHYLIRNSRHGLVLISPYFDPWQEIADGIDEALDRGVRVMIVVRDGQFDSAEAAMEFEDQGAVVCAVPDLHAKLYFSELQAISTSMNLLVSSANTAVELGSIFDAATDEQHYRQLIAESERLAPSLRWGALVAGQAQPPARGLRERSPRVVGRQVQQGHCIRCGDLIRFDLERPFCETHMRSWSRFQNLDYPESFCHRCGEPAPTSMARPRCYACWQADP